MLYSNHAEELQISGVALVVLGVAKLMVTNYSANTDIS